MTIFATDHLKAEEKMMAEDMYQVQIVRRTNIPLTSKELYLNNISIFNFIHYGALHILPFRKGG